jgi:pimeloyl-ACP methyl ester carboxylesterase
VRFEAKLGRSSIFMVPAACLILLSCSVRHIVYPTPAVSVADPPRPLRSVEWSLADGSQISAWVHDDPVAPPRRPVVLFLHGNGENLETMRQAGLFEELLALDVPFVALDYPGYGRSSGAPSESSLLAAGSVALEWMHQHFAGRPRIVVGWSLGAAVAVGLAAANPDRCDGVVAMSAWTSLADVGAAHLPRWLVEIAVADRYESTGAAEQVTCPGLVIHGSRDQIIPVDQGREVGQALGAEWLEVPTAGHNDLLSHDIVWRRLADFLTSTQDPAPSERSSGL